MPQIRGYHAHIYFDAETLEQAKALCHQADQEFDIEMGRIHEKPVGPHPMWSCQLAFKPETFASIVPWLAINRKGLIVFLHPETGDDLKDHSDHAIWMGDMLDLDLSVLKPAS